MQKAFEKIEEKIKVTSLEIIVTGTKEKPYFEIKYKEVGKEDYNIGYSSYDLNNVFEWKEECFEIVNQVAEEYKSTEHINCSTDDLISRSALLSTMDGRYKEKQGNVPDNLAEGFMQMEKLIKEQPTVSVDDGWVPCSERLPEIAGHEVLATLENASGQRRITIIFTGYGLSSFWHCNHKEFDLNVWKVIAWRELPAPYQPKGE